MDGHARVKETLSEYALGTLPQGEAAAVRAHLRVCAECKAELAAWEDTVSRLALSVPSKEPPPDLLAKVIARAVRRAPALGPLALAACLFAAVGVGVLGAALLWPRGGQAAPASSALRSAPAALVVALSGTPAAPLAQGQLILSPDRKSAILVVDRLALLPAGRNYQLWLHEDGERTSAGVFSVDFQGTAAIFVQADHSLAEYSGCTITVEPAGGSSRPTGENVLSGALRL